MMILRNWWKLLVFSLTLSKHHKKMSKLDSTSVPTQDGYASWSSRKILKYLPYILCQIHQNQTCPANKYENRKLLIMPNIMRYGPKYACSMDV